MTGTRTGTRLTHGTMKYVLDSDPGQVTYRTLSATNLNPKLYTDSAASNATGAITFGLPTGYFASIQHVNACCMRDTANPALAAFALIRSVTLSSVVVQCFESKNTGVLLGGNIEGLELATSAMTVMLMVVGT